jgi:hypothetical protein
MAAPSKHRDEKDSPSDHWYPFEAKLNYCIVRGREVRGGRGMTLAMSSSGVVFKSKDTIPAGSKIEVWLDWPVRLDNAVTLHLHINGKTLRSENGHTAVSFLGYEFCPSTPTALPICRIR